MQQALGREKLEGLRYVHLVGIGGVGMSALAILLREKGFVVSGSDCYDSYNLDLLKRVGIKVYLGHSINNVRGAEIICYSSAIKLDNVEIKEALRLRIPIIKRGELLSYLINDKRVVAISGSHGKTTTASFVGFMLNKLGYNCGGFIGGMPLNTGKSAWLGRDIFVVEADESDGSFLFFTPWVSIITNIDCEHLDFYKDMNTLKESFKEFVKKTKSKVIGCGDDRIVDSLLKERQGITYGLTEANYIKAKNIRYRKEGMLFDVSIGNQYYKDLAISLWGKHNVMNTLAVIGFLDFIGESIDKYRTILKEFKGVKRRLQIKGMYKGVTFMDDYAHHPQEIKAVLETVVNLGYKRLVVIFQPHRYSRLKILKEDFVSCFNLCDYLFVTDIYAAGEKVLEEVNLGSLISEIKKNFKGRIVYIPKDKLEETIPTYLQEGDLLLGLGAGDINLLMEGIRDRYVKFMEKLYLRYNKEQ